MKSFLQLVFVTFCAAGVFAQAPSPAKPKPGAPAKPASAPKKTAPAKTAAPSAPAASVPAAEKPVLVVGSQSITAKEFEGFIAALPEQVQAQARGPMKRQLAEQIVRVKLMAEEARKQGLDKDPILKAKVQFQTENLLAGEYYQNLMKSAGGSDADMQKYFADHKNEFEQAAARHILIRFKGSPVPLRDGQKDLTEEEALAKAADLRKKIEGGEDFAAIAKAESDDTGSGANGGDLGTFKRGSMVPPFEAAVFSMKPGEMSQPVKTQFGYHVIKLEKFAGQNYEEAKAEIEKRIKPEQARKQMEELRAKSPVTIDDAYFGPEPAKAAPPQTAPGTPAPAPAAAK